MTLHFDWLHWPNWHPHVSRAMSVVLGVIAVSALFSALRIVDGAVSGALGDVPPAPVPEAQPVLFNDAPPAGASQPANLIEVPPASADAISL